MAIFNSFLYVYQRVCTPNVGPAPETVPCRSFPQKDVGFLPRLGMLILSCHKWGEYNRTPPIFFAGYLRLAIFHRPFHIISIPLSWALDTLELRKSRWVARPVAGQERENGWVPESLSQGFYAVSNVSTCWVLHLIILIYRQLM